MFVNNTINHNNNNDNNIKHNYVVQNNSLVNINHVTLLILNLL